MRICDLRGLSIGLLGLGREGHATLEALRRVGHDGVIHILSDNLVPVPAETVLHAGEAGVGALAELDILIRSPGFRLNHPLRQAADALHLVQTTATNLFLAELRHEGLPVIGITGSKGKSTTSTLAHLALEQAGIASMLVGNIGRPALDDMDQIVSERRVTVMELSSYHCDDLRDGFGPTVACLLDLFPEHIDWHGSIEAYYGAKARIALTQRAGDVFCCNGRSAFQFAGVRLHSAVEWINTPEGLHFADGWFRRGGERLFPDTDMVLPGPHNRENAVAALAVAARLGARPEDMQSVLASFRGLPFRLQDEGVHDGIRWVNDSLSTAPEAVAAALRALGPAVRTLIAGGYDRGYDPVPLVDAVAHSGVRTLILLPGTGAAIARCVREFAPEVDRFEVEALDEAVALARERTPAGFTCLFSPGAPSYNRYRSFEERGLHFRRLLGCPSTEQGSVPDLDIIL